MLGVEDDDVEVAVQTRRSRACAGARRHAGPSGRSVPTMRYAGRRGAGVGRLPLRIARPAGRSGSTSVSTAQARRHEDALGGRPNERKQMVGLPAARRHLPADALGAGHDPRPCRTGLARFCRRRRRAPATVLGDHNGGARSSWSSCSRSRGPMVYLAVDRVARRRRWRARDDPAPAARPRANLGGGRAVAETSTAAVDALFGGERRRGPEGGEAFRPGHELHGA